MNEREIKGVGIVVGLGLLGMVILNGAYRAGFAAGFAQGGNPTGVVPHGGGFFPFPPFLLLIVGVVLFVAWRRRGIGSGPGSSGRGPGGGPPKMFEEWHRRAHQADAAESAPPQSAPTETRSSDTTIV